jgi:hypothetical protein
MWNVDNDKGSKKLNKKIVDKHDFIHNIVNI